MTVEMHVDAGPDRAPRPQPTTPQEPPRRRRRGRRLVAGVLVGGLVLALAGALVNVVLVGRLERIEGAFTGLADRPAGAPGRTFLLVATRPGTAGGADVPWLEDEQSVEAVMLIEVAADGLTARVETLPGRSGVAGVAAGDRPSDTVAAVESWSGRRVDHLIAIDWATFVRLAEHHGVDPAYDYGSRPAAQHRFLQRVMEGTLHQELRKRPLDLYRVLSTTIDGTAVDDGWSVAEMDLLVLSLRNLRSYAIDYSMAEPG